MTIRDLLSQARNKVKDRLAWWAYKAERRRFVSKLVASGVSPEQANKMAHDVFLTVAKANGYKPTKA